jgi:hypothetical protein
MSFIHIRKYKETDGKIKNYFDNPAFVDEFYTQKFFIDGIPNYREELNSKDDFFKFLAGDFTIIFSMLETELSAEGYTIKEFIKPQHDFNKLFFVYIRLENKDLFGILDVSSVIIDYTKTEKKYEVKADVYALEKHFTEAIGKPLRVGPPYPNLSHVDINTFIQYYLFISKETGKNFWDNSPFINDYFNVDFSLLFQKWTNELGWGSNWPPRMIWEAWNNILDKLEADQIELDSGWDYFYDYFQQLGFVYKFVMDETQDDDEYFKVTLKLFYRDQGITNWGELGAFALIKTHKEKVLLDAHKYVIFKTMHITTDSFYWVYNGKNYNPRYGGAIAAPGGLTFINDCEYKGPGEPGDAATMVFDYPDIPPNDPNAVNGRDKIVWDGYNVPDISPVAIDDCKIVDENNDHIFAINRFNILEPYSWRYVFYNHAKQTDGSYHDISVSLPRLCVKEYYYESVGGQGSGGYRVLHDTGWDDLFRLSIEQYPFLYLGDKTVKEFEIIFQSGQIPQVGDTFTFQGYLYFINRITKLDFRKHILKIDEAIEIKEAA